MGNFQMKEKHYLKGTDIEKPTSDKQMGNSKTNKSRDKFIKYFQPAELCHAGDAGTLSPS